MDRFLLGAGLALIFVGLGCLITSALMDVTSSPERDPGYEVVGVTERCTVSVIRDNVNERLVYVVSSNSSSSWSCGISVQYDGE